MHSISERLTPIDDPAVIMAVGIPGSGKSYAMREVAQDLDATYVCVDDIRQELTGNAADQSVNGQAWEIAQDRVHASIDEGHTAIVDATHTERKRRIEAVELYRGFGARAIYAVVFDTPFPVAARRNAARDREVPMHALKRMQNQLQREPIRMSEGFDQVIFHKHQPPRPRTLAPPAYNK